MRDASGSLSKSVFNQIDSVVREECRRAVEESVYRIFRIFWAEVADTLPEGVYVPPTEIMINAGDVGFVKIRGFNTQRNA